LLAFIPRRDHGSPVCRVERRSGTADLVFSKDWASKRITVNAIAPGYLISEMNTALMKTRERPATTIARIPAGKWGRSEDFKAQSPFLCQGGKCLCVRGFDGQSKNKRRLNKEFFYEFFYEVLRARRLISK